jgi:hypothetical protein
MKWQAGLRVPRFWNYMFRIGPGPAKLTIDGKEVLNLAADRNAGEATVALARGDHMVEYEGTVTSADNPASFYWVEQPPLDGDGNRPAPDWKPVATEQLISNMQKPRGLFKVLQVKSPDKERAVQWSIDNTIMTCCLGDEYHTEGQPYTAKWTGTLEAPATGTYSMTLQAQATGDFKIDDKTVFHLETATEDLNAASVDLAAGPHQVEFSVEGTGGPGRFEWTWTPPGGEKSIVPPSVLSPPSGAGIDEELPADTLGPRDWQPTDNPLDLVP